MDDLEALQSVERIINYLVTRLCKQLPTLDREELISESQIVALQAVRIYNRDRKTALTSWVYTCVSRYLYRSSQSRKWRDRMRVPYTGTPIDQAEEPSHLETLFQSVSPEAEEVIKLALTKNKDDKLSLLRTLVNEFAFEKAEIVKIWKEIREAL